MRVNTELDNKAKGKNEAEFRGEDCVCITCPTHLFVHTIVAVPILITHQLGVDADLGVVSCAGEVVWVGAGQASIAWVTAGLAAVVRIPVVGAVFFSDECTEILAVFPVCEVIKNFSRARADGLIVNSYILFLGACLIHCEDPV